MLLGGDVATPGLNHCFELKTGVLAQRCQSDIGVQDFDLRTNNQVVSGHLTFALYIEPNRFLFGLSKTKADFFEIQYQASDIFGHARDC
jgi:hypothetical protein